jgi:hypothetical protein
MLGLSLEELGKLLSADGVRTHHVRELWGTIHRKAISDPSSAILGSRKHR